MIKIAFASSSGDRIDQHFGWSEKFYLYEVDKHSSRFLEIIDSSQEPEEEKEKLDYKIDTIKDADIIYCTKIGPMASRMVQSSGIYPVRVIEGENISEAIKKLQQMLLNNPPIWLLRIFHKSKARCA